MKRGRGRNPCRAALDAEVAVTGVGILKRWAVIITHYALLGYINNVSGSPVALRCRTKCVSQHRRQL